MRLFSKLYDKVLHWSGHPHAERYLAGVSFAESSFFPIPPDVLLAPMTLAQPRRWVRFALLTTVASVLGGLLGYVIGYLALEAVTPLLHKVGYWHHSRPRMHGFSAMDSGRSSRPGLRPSLTRCSRSRQGPRTWGCCRSSWAR